ncbi:DUF1343 domain-containing protein [soil metagenome]
MTQVKFGVDQLIEQDALPKIKRMALVCNHASLTAHGIPTRLALLKHGFNLVKLFSPEHGLNAKGIDGTFQKDGKDELTGLPVISLYGDRLAPTGQDLFDVDYVLFDVPDIGCRFYTYLWTMTHVMEACTEFAKPLIILDRPNLIGGNLSLTEGPMLDEICCASFIGRWNIPLRHSCTLGELAKYFKAVKMPALQLEVIPAKNWDRIKNTGYIFTPTSPAITGKTAALLYPGMGLLEGINVNEGRGTPSPFEICGAPWIDPYQLHETFSHAANAGVVCEPVSYIPDAGLYAGEICTGLKFTVVDDTVFRPVQTGISLVRCIDQCAGSDLAERLYCTLANPSGNSHLDKLLGVQHAFNLIKNGVAINTSVSQQWIELINNFLLY